MFLRTTVAFQGSQGPEDSPHQSSSSVSRERRGQRSAGGGGPFTLGSTLRAACALLPRLSFPYASLNGLLGRYQSFLHRSTEGKTECLASSAV